MKEFIPKSHQGPRVINSKSSNQLSDEYRDSITISYQYLGEKVAPDTTFRIGKCTVSTPIMAGPVSMRAITADKPELAYARAVNEAGSVFWSHFFGAENYEELLKEMPVSVNEEAWSTINFNDPIFTEEDLSSAS